MGSGCGGSVFDPGNHPFFSPDATDSNPVEGMDGNSNRCLKDCVRKNRISFFAISMGMRRPALESCFFLCLRLGPGIVGIEEVFLPVFTPLVIPPF